MVDSDCHKIAATAPDITSSHSCTHTEAEKGQFCLACLSFNKREKLGGGGSGRGQEIEEESRMAIELTIDKVCHRWPS